VDLIADLTSTGLSANFVATLAHAAAQETGRAPSAKAVVNALLRKKSNKTATDLYPLMWVTGSSALRLLAKLYLPGVV